MVRTERLPVAGDDDVGPLQRRQSARPQGRKVARKLVTQRQERLPIGPLDYVVLPPEEVSCHKPGLATRRDEERGVIGRMARRRENLDSGSGNELSVGDLLVPPVNEVEIADLRLGKEADIEDVVQVRMGDEY